MVATRGCWVGQVGEETVKPEGEPTLIFLCLFEQLCFESKKE